MSQWHLDELHKALTQRGWQIVAQHPGDEHKISASWEIQRSTKSSTLFVDFEGFDDMQCRPLSESYGCSIRGHEALSVYFGKSRKKWKKEVEALLAGLDSLSGRASGASVKQGSYQESIDPEYQRWGKKYRRFPGVAECVRLIRDGKARGAWADIIVAELAEHAGECLAELIDAFRADSDETVRLYIIMALDMAHVPESVPFLAEVIREGNPRLASNSEDALRAIDTREARTALWEAKHSPGRD